MTLPSGRTKNLARVTFVCLALGAVCVLVFVCGFIALIFVLMTGYNILIFKEELLLLF